MKSSLSAFLLMILHLTLTRGESCLECYTSTGFICLTITQYYTCDAFGDVDISVLYTCDTGVCDSSINSNPCSLTSVPLCPYGAFPTPSATTITSTTVTETSTAAETSTESSTTPVITSTSISVTETSTQPSTTSVPVTTSVSETSVSTTISAPSSTSTSSVPTTTPSTTPSVFDANNFCSSQPVGRFALPTSTDCTQYVNCFLNNGMKGAIYTCVGSTLFDPSKGACVVDYVCSPPVMASTAPPTTVASTQAPTTVPTTLAPTTAPTTLAATTISTTLAPFDPNAWCLSQPAGRYALPYKTACTQYVYCYLNAGMKGAIYTCVGTTLFDKTKGSCVNGYVCVEA